MSFVALRQPAAAQIGPRTRRVLNIVLGGAVATLSLILGLLAVVVNPQIGQVLVGLVLATALLLFYFLPTVVAGLNHRRNAPAIFILNLLLGWTLLGWVGALVWATVKDRP